MKETKRIIYLDKLPRYTEGRYKDKINWKKSIGYILKFIYDDITGNIKIIEYCYNDKNRPYLKVKYNNEIYNIACGHLCECKIGNIIGNKSKKYLYSVDDVVYVNTGNILILEHTRIKQGKHTTKAYKYKCLECNYTGIITETHLKESCGCSVCSPSPRKVAKGINDIATTHPHLIEYFVNVEDAYSISYASNKKVPMKCPDCGAMKEISPNTLLNSGLGCICSDSISYGEKLIFSVLKQLKINFTFQLSKTTLKWCKNYRYDFHFESNNESYILEANGNQHYCDAWDKLEKTKLNDKLKKELSLVNGIKSKNYIIIDCRKSELEFVKQNILNSRLNELFDLSSIDWLKCHKYALSNLVKEACRLWDSGICSTTQIANIMHVHRVTICTYLKHGKRLGWTTYDERIARDISEGKLGKNAKEVKCIENGLIFESCAELERQSEKIFGVYLNQNNVSGVCRNVRKSYKGYTFVYTK